MHSNNSIIRWVAMIIVVVLGLVGLIYIDQMGAEAKTEFKTPVNSYIIRDVAYVPMGTSETSSLGIIEITSHSLIDTINLQSYGCNEPQRVRLNPLGTELYITCRISNNIVILSAEDFSLLGTIDQPNAQYQDVAFVRSGAYALFTGIPNLINIVDTSTHGIVQSISVPGLFIRNIAAHPFLPFAYASGKSGGLGKIVVIDTNEFSVLTEITYGGDLFDVVVSPDGHWLYSGDWYDDGLVKVEVPSNTIVDTLASFSIRGLSISPDGAKLFVSREQTPNFQVVDTSDMEPITAVDTGPNFESALSCDGSEVYIALWGTSIPVINTTDYDIAYDIPIPVMAYGYGIAICPPSYEKPVFLTPVKQIAYVRAGVTKTYTMELFNMTGQIGNFTLQVLPGNQWPTVLSTDELGPLNPGESASFTAQVITPPNADPTESDTAIIQATSVVSPVLTDMSTLTTTIISDRLVYVSIRESNSVAIIDTLLHTSIGIIDTAQYGCIGPGRVRISPNGSDLYILCDDSSNVLIIRTSDRTKAGLISHAGAYSQDVTFVRHGDYALVSGILSDSNSPLLVIDTASHTLINTIPTQDHTLFSIVAHPYLQLAYVPTPNHIIVVDTNTFTISYLALGSIVRFIQPSPDGLWLYAIDQNGLLKIDRETNMVVASLNGVGGGDLAISPDGAKLYAENFHTIQIIDTNSMSLINEFDIGAYTNASALTCDGKELYIARDGKEIPVLNAQDDNFTYQIAIPAESDGYGVTVCRQYLEGVPLVVAPGFVSVSGPAEGEAGISYKFSASVEPISTTLPISYTWVTIGNETITHTAGLTDTVNITWYTSGPKLVTIMASNGYGSVANEYEIDITTSLLPIYLPLAQNAPVGGIKPDQ